MTKKRTRKPSLLKGSRAAARKAKERAGEEPETAAAGADQDELPGIPPAEPPEGPLQFRVSSDRGRSMDAGKRQGKSREILVTLSKPYTARHAEVAPMLDQPVKVSDVSGHRQEECKLVRYSGVVGKDGATVRATIATGADGHKWLGALVTVVPMQPDLGL